MKRFLLIAFVLLSACKSSYKQVEITEINEKKDRVEIGITDVNSLTSLMKDLSVNLNKRLDFIIYDTSKIVDGKPPILVEGTLTDKSTTIDKSVSEEQITDRSEVVIEDKGQVNIRDKLQIEEKKNNKSWIEQLTRFGFVILLLACVGVYVKKRWF